MHAFTPQQRRGGATFHGSQGAAVLLGNWSEEVSQGADSLATFLQAKRTGTTRSDQFAAAMATALAPVALPAHGPGSVLRFGEPLQLAHVHTGAVLAVDVREQDPVLHTCAATATSDAASSQPVARSTFLLAAHEAARLDAHDGGVVRFGQHVRLLANPMAQGEPLAADGGSRPLALFSCPQGPTTASRSRNQLAAFSTWEAASFNCVWQVQPLDPAKTLLLEGAPVPVGSPVLLVHAATLVPLALDAGVRHPNDFGSETAVSCRADTSWSKQLALEHAARGDTKLPKPALGANHWMFVGARAAESGDGA